MQARPKQAWIRPELTPLTDTGVRSDSVDTPQRNLNGTILN